MLTKESQKPFVVTQDNMTRTGVAYDIATGDRLLDYNIKQLKNKKVEKSIV